MLNSSTSLEKADSPQMFPGVLVSNRYNILDKSQDNSKDCNDITNKQDCYDSLVQEEKSREIERLRAIISESEEKIVRLEKQLSTKTKLLEFCKFHHSKMKNVSKRKKLMSFRSQTANQQKRKHPMSKRNQVCHNPGKTHASPGLS